MRFIKHNCSFICSISAALFLSACQSMPNTTPVPVTTPTSQVPAKPNVSTHRLKKEPPVTPILLDRRHTNSEGVDPIEEANSHATKAELEAKRAALQEQIAQLEAKKAAQIQADEAAKRAMIAKEQKRNQRVRASIIAAQRKNTSTTDKVRIRNGANLPAFNRLMKLGIQKLRNNQLNAAKQNFISAQRIAPQSPAVYMYLSQIALKQGHATKAESLARKGLVVSRSSRYDKALWKAIYLSGKMRNNTSVMNDALRNLKKFN